jgi:hypothetical protein
VFLRRAAVRHHRAGGGRATGQSLVRRCFDLNWHRLSVSENASQRLFFLVRVYGRTLGREQ